MYCKLFRRIVSFEQYYDKGIPSLKYLASARDFDDNSTFNYVVINGTLKYIKYRSAYRFVNTRDTSLGYFAIGFKEKFVKIDSLNPNPVTKVTNMNVGTSRMYTEKNMYTYLTVPPFWIIMMGARIN